MSGNIQKLVDEALAIELKTAEEAGALGYMARSLVQATMPHSNPGNVEAWGRENGKFSIVIQPGVIKKDGELVRIGLPYGNIPRLLLAWVTTEAVRTKSTNLELGPTLSNFMYQLGLIPSGGRWGTINRLHEQMKRLFSASISCYYDGSDANSLNNTTELVRKGLNITKSYSLWWNPKQPGQSALWKSEVTLNKDFFDEIISYPVPIDMRVLKAIKQSPMALDIYCWMTYRASYLKKTTQIPWATLQMQFGASYKKDSQGIRNFKKAFLRELKKVKEFYNHAKTESGEYGLILKPSLSHIPRKSKSNSKNQISSQTKEREQEKSKELYKIYNEHLRIQLIDIVEQELNSSKKKQLLCEFQQYLIRSQVKDVNVNDLKDSVSKNWFFRFVSNNHHHLIERLQTFDEFVDSNK